MKQRIKMILTSLGLMGGMAFAVSAPALAVDPGFGACSGNSGSKVCQARSTDNVYTILKNVINILLVLIGMIAVIMIVVGGIKYVVSAGDSNAVNGAKNTILYAVVGLVIAIMSYAIVNFVIGRI